MGLISADALADKMRKMYCEDCDSKRQEICKDSPLCFFLAYIDAAPTIDAVPVVRCKDCKYYRESQYFPNEKICGLSHLFHSEDFFCASGERKNNETN